MNNLQILSKEIRQLDGLYLLNDLHKASGGLSKHRPSYFLDLKQTKDLAAEVSIAGIPAIEKKQRVGTYASKEILLSYGMWISPKVNFAVISAFFDKQEPREQKFVEPPKELTLTPAQQNHIQQRVSQVVKNQIGTSYANLWGSIKNHFKVGTYKDIKACLYPDVCEFLKCKPQESEITTGSNVPDGYVVIKQQALEELLIRISRMSAGVNVVQLAYGQIMDATNELLLSAADERTIN